MICHCLFARRAQLDVRSGELLGCFALVKRALPERNALKVVGPNVERGPERKRHDVMFVRTHCREHVAVPHHKDAAR